MSCAHLPVEDADHHEQRGLEQAWASTSSEASTTVSAVPSPNITTMNPSWLTVP
jgi:hypothetical protein